MDFHILVDLYFEHTEPREIVSPAEIFSEQPRTLKRKDFEVFDYFVSFLFYNSNKSPKMLILFVLTHT